MKTKLSAAMAIFLVSGKCGLAHRLDEYLQATILSIEKNRIQAFIRLVPGVAVSPAVIASIDSDGNGVLSDEEQRNYVRRVMADLRLKIDGKSAMPSLVSMSFPAVGEMKEGLGEIQIELAADLPRGGVHRKITLENHHQNRISAYLVNTLVPRDKSIQITGQNRNENQSFYELHCDVAGSESAWRSRRDRSGVQRWPYIAALLLFAALASVRRKQLWDHLTGVYSARKPDVVESLRTL